MTEVQRDALYGRVFATPAGAELLADLRKRSHLGIVISDIERRVERQRERWAGKEPE